MLCVSQMIPEQSLFLISWLFYSDYVVIDAVFITNASFFQKFFPPKLEMRILNPAGRLTKVFGEEKLYQ